MCLIVFHYLATPPRSQELSPPTLHPPIPHDDSAELPPLHLKDERELQRSFDRAVHRDYPVVDFVRSVWKFDPERIPARRGGYSLPFKLCNQYAGSLNTTDLSHGSFALLKKLFEHVLGQLRMPQALRASFKYTQDLSLGRGIPVPTFAWGTTDKPASQRWEWFGLVGDFSKTEQRDYRFKKDIRVDLSELWDVRSHT